MQDVSHTLSRALTQHPRRQLKQPPVIEGNSIGMGLRAPHHQAVVQHRPAVDWLEVHSENYFNPQGSGRHYLDQLAEHYPLSFHGVGLSLGSCDPLNSTHLRQLQHLIEQYRPALVSEHLSWSSYNGQYFNDLLPLPYTREALDHVCQRIDQVQQLLGRPLLIENPTTYLTFDHSDMTEWEFMAELHHRSGCSLLLDLNNIYVNSINLGYSSADYLAAIPKAAIGEIHLAGFTRKILDSGEILIDTHGSPVSEPVWQLFRELRQHTDAPALIEWDTDIPALNVLLAEAQRARQEQAGDPVTQKAGTKAV